MFWITFGILFAATTISYFLQPKPPAPKKPQFEDLNTATVDAASVIPEVFGTKWVKSNNVVWYGDLKVDAIKTKGGKK